MDFFLSLILTLLFTGASLALPFTGEKRDMDSGLLATFNLMEQYSAAAYCKNNQKTPGDQITCSFGVCPLVQAANASSIIEYASTSSTGVTGYVGLDPTHQLIIVAFRGSVSIENWLTNFNWKTVSTDICSGCTAHAGFWQSWLDSRDAVRAAVKKLAQANPSYTIAATGHSLGGAVASLAAASLRNDGYKATLYSFGSPRLAGSKLSSYISNQAGGNYRVTHWNDPVPRVPTLLQGYVHISPEYYINKPNGKGVAVGDFKTYQGSTNLRGNAAWILTDIFAHLWYFNGIASCVLS